MAENRWRKYKGGFPQQFGCYIWCINKDTILLKKGKLIWYGWKRKAPANACTGRCFGVQKSPRRERGYDVWHSSYQIRPLPRLVLLLGSVTPCPWVSRLWLLPSRWLLSPVPCYIFPPSVFSQCLSLLLWQFFFVPQCKMFQHHCNCFLISACFSRIRLLPSPCWNCCACSSNW